MKTWTEYAFFMLFRALARRLSLRTAGRVGAVLGGLVFRLTPVRKKVTLDNLALAFPEKSAAERRMIALGAFRNYGSAIFEMFRIGRSTDEELRGAVRWVNAGVPCAAYARGKGIIMLSAHFGSWELVLPAIKLSFGWPVMAIVQQQRNARINLVVDAQRRRFVDTTIPMARAVREVLRGLREKQALVILGDQSGSKESLFIPFFGRPAATHRGAAAFALRSGAPLVLFLVVRAAAGYEICCEEIDYADIAGYTEDHIVELTRRHAAVLERFIRAHPDHWLWQHKRWKHTAFYEARHDQGQSAPEDDGT
ncbi:MAG TPA: lysophospholipid acyltransferase family protein [Bacteroidota bacterium]